MMTRTAWPRWVVILLPPISALAQFPVTPAGVGSADNPHQISQLGHLVWMSETVGSSSGKFYVVQNHIDATETASWNDGKGFVPIGSYSPFQPFNGTFNGNGKTISGLTIHCPSESFVGLIGLAGHGSEVKDLHLSGGAITGSNHVGTIVGYNGGIVTACCAIGSVTGTNEVGGLVGDNWGTIANCHITSSWISGCVAVGGLVGKNNGTVSESHAEAAVCGAGRVGGLVGYNPTISSVSGCYATGPVTGTSNYVGGLVGSNFGVLRRCHATGPVSGMRAGIGGLIGYTDLDADVSNCYATGPVMGHVSVGGLIGINNGLLHRCYATGSATGTNHVGGLVGVNNKTVSECYSAGPVTGLTAYGGLVGTNHLLGTVSNSYWDIHASGQVSSAAGAGRATAEMKRQANFAEWDFVDFWRIDEGASYPHFSMPPRMHAPAIDHGTALVVRWCSRSDHTYAIRYSTNLLSGFSVLQTGIVATPPINSFTDAFNGAIMKFWTVSADE